ncbi:MAG: radical SAM protein [Firmicutes bacterium]|nr:radical SAM protein [Bacillota bacterium]
MHYTGTIWRPPYEASSLLLEVTAGCSHHGCKFCTLYNDLPFKFKITNPEIIKADLKEAQKHMRLWKDNRVSRTFLTGANPFILKAPRLIELAGLIKQYFPENKTIGCFARITDITLKTDKELHALKTAGFDGLTIGIETGDDEALRFMNKGYDSAEILTQCKRLDNAGISYNFFYLVGICGAGKGVRGAKATAAICNRLNPKIIGANMLTVFSDSELYQEILKGNWHEETEIEKYEELKILVENLAIPVRFAALGASNIIQIQGELPDDKNKLTSLLDKIINDIGENELNNYRRNLRHL